MIGTADHGNPAMPSSSHAPFYRPDDVAGDAGGRVGVEALDICGDLPPRGDRLDGSLNLGKDVVPAGKLDVADVDFENDLLGNAVDRTGMDAADARGRDRVGAAARSRGPLDGQDRFGGGERRRAGLASDRAGVSALAFPGDPQARPVRRSR